MSTSIYNTYSDFLNRSDKDANGVSPDFAETHSKYVAENQSNKACWNSSDCSHCSHCSHCSDCSDCSDCFDCSDCSHCSHCSDCSDCSDCFGCSRCSDCSDCFGCFGKKDIKSDKSLIPKIKNIHQAVLTAVEKPDAGEMKAIIIGAGSIAGTLFFALWLGLSYCPTTIPIEFLP